MKQESYHRYIPFEGIYNFRDLGGYRTRDGRTVIWRQIFRSGEMQHMTADDAIRFRDEIPLVSVLDLRSLIEVNRHGIGRLQELGISHNNISFIGNPGSEETLKWFKASLNMGDFYLYLFKHTKIGLHVIEALNIISKPENRPVVFHCVGGKDRTGILAAIILSILGVSDDDIIKDYALTRKHMPGLISRINNDPQRAVLFKQLPHFVAEASAEAMAFFLTGLKEEYGSITRMMKSYGVSNALINRLRSTLLTD